MWITNGSVADWYFVVAYTDPSQRYKGMSAFVVPRDSPGIEVGKKEQNLGQRASDTRAVTFNEVKVPKANLIGQEGKGFLLAMSAFDHSRPVVSAAAVGLARSAMDHAIRYARERTTFGVPIHKHQALAFMVAEMAMKVEAARLLVWQSAWKIDRGERNTKEAAFAKAFQIYEGTSQIQRLIIAKEIFERS